MDKREAPKKKRSKKRRSKKVATKKDTARVARTARTTKVAEKGSVRATGPGAKGGVIYLDNNGTTLICPQAFEAHKKWLACYNPSSNSKVSKSAKKLMDNAKDYILRHCSTDASRYTAVFTSGATESNCFILRSCVESYRRMIGKKPHVIISSIEHHSTMECAKSIEEADYAEISLIEPNMYGCILPGDVKSAIKPNTCLISIMYANNEIGAINNIPAIGEIAHEHKIPLHTDAVQIFGKYPVNLMKTNVDAVSASFHKFYGPKGIGLLLLKNDLISGYDLKGQICGSQQNGLRGGTENVPAIASAMVSLQCAFRNRQAKNRKLLAMRTYIIEKMSENTLVQIGDYAPYVALRGDQKANSQGDQKANSQGDQTSRYNPGLSEEPPGEGQPRAEIVILGPPLDKPNYYLPNTLLISIAKGWGLPFCNVKFKEALDKKGIVVSIASACLTSSKKASHVLTAIGAPDVIKRGTLRISIGDCNVLDEIKTFIKVFFELLEKALAK